MRQNDVAAATRALLDGGLTPAHAQLARTLSAMSALTHIGAAGEAHMVDVSAKAATERVAIAEGQVVMRPRDARARSSPGDAKKGDVLGAARIAGHHGGQADARTDPALPSHRADQASASISKPDAALPGLIVRAEAKTHGQTGVEMEALTAVSVACLTIYDMAKAVDRGMRIEGVRLIEKRGGKSGLWRAEDAP